MSLIRVVVTLEVSQEGVISAKSFDIEQVGLSQKGATQKKAQPVLNGEDVVSIFLSNLLHNQNETGVLRMLIEARHGGARVYRGQILSALGFGQLLQWNGVSAWLTRHWRAATGNPNADITAIRYDRSQDDYEITFAPSISDEIIARLAEGLGIGT
jgi:hypothetical protein